MNRLITRREMTAGMLAAGATLATGQHAVRAAGANERIRVGIVGCRNRGHQVAANLLGTKRFEIAALCDCDAAMLDVAMKQLDGKLDGKPRLEQDFRKLLDDPRIDAIVNATPDHWHALIAVLALDAGKHLYTEKPLSYNYADGAAMVAAAKRHPRQTVLVGTQQRSAPHFHSARKFIAEGGLGKVAFARGWITFDRGAWPKVHDSDPPATLDYDMWVGPAPMQPYNQNRLHYNWHFLYDYGTGDLGNWGAHWLDSIRHLLDLGIPLAASGVGGSYVVNDVKEWPDTQTVLYEYPGLTVLWELREWTPRGVHDRSQGAEISGDKGVMVIDRAGWTVYAKEGEPVTRPGGNLESPHAGNFADCITGSAKPNASVEEGHKTATLIHLGNIATLVRRRVAWDAAAERIIDDDQANGYLSRPYRQPWSLTL